MLNFVKQVNKVKRSSKEIVRHALRECREASCPQLAKITALSRVTIGKALSSLEAEGRVERCNMADSSGGRPAQLYRYRIPRAARTCLFTLQRRGAVYVARMELLSQDGWVESTIEASFAYLDKGSFDQWLDNAHAQSSWKVLYCIDENIEIAGFREHMKCRYGMTMRAMSIAALALRQESDALALCFHPLRVPQAAIRKDGKSIDLPHIELLPQPADWKSLDYSDLSLVEEMIARLMLMLCCTHAPKRIYLYDQCWTDRLITRVKFNLASKLHNYMNSPKLIFVNYPEADFREAMRAFACDFLKEDN